MLESTNITVQSHYIITLFQKVYDTQIFQLKPLHFFGGAMLRETSGVFHFSLTRTHTPLNLEPVAWLRVTYEKDLM